QVRRYFPRCFFDLSPEELATVDLSPELLEGWVALLDEFVGPGTHFLAHNADAHLLRAAAGLLEARPRIRSLIHLGFHTSPRRMPGRAQGDEAHRVIVRLRRAPEWERSVFFWTENQRLGDWMSRWLRAPVPTLPLLAPSGPGAGFRERKPEDRLTISVLGESRPSKGFLDLPRIVEAIAASPPLAAAVHVVIQNWRPVSGYTVEHEQAVARLRSHPFVEIVEGMLDDDDYARRLADADALLLPYDPEIYNLRGSGILIEGMSRGAVILARAGTAMEDAGKDGVVLTYETPDDLVEVLIGLLNNFNETAERARRLADRFREPNSSQRYVGALDGRARGKLHGPRPIGSGDPRV
ncbi:MAG: hypothetical protein M3Y27_21940, partial [Acidobacteriota bacterium]|nr:hypothetical protein [Acidobacteriota bacterium]